ncbi:MAG: DNA lyase [Burkholderiales bacterium]|nr:DNA lyase [Burkholderiales bacterium]
MRLWSLHPQYLDAKGLVALWREALLAQAVLAGLTRGYKHHPQLARFLASPAPRRHIAAYLRTVHAEAVRRGYRFDESKIARGGMVEPLTVTRGQLEFEWHHLAAKLEVRAPAWLEQIGTVKRPRPHPLFRVVPGAVAEWEAVVGKSVVAAGAPRSRARK